jgi:ABC-type Na+ efflux pump permease subunit
MTIVTIARSTAREALHVPVLHVLVIGAVVLVAIAAHLPRFTMNSMDDLKMLKDLALATATLAGLLVAVFTAANVVTAEIENWTVVTLLSKPVRRWEFVAGKWLGIVVTLAAVFGGMMLLLIPVVWWGMWSYAQDWVNIRPELIEGFWHNAWDAANDLSRGFAMAFLQVVALTGVATALCVRLPVAVSATVVIALFVGGNFVSALGKTGAFIAALLVADQGAIAFSPESASNAMMPLAGIAWGALYAFAYALAGVLAGVLLFRNREVI